MNEDSQGVVAEINSYISLAKKRQYGLFKMIEFLENLSTPQERLLFEKFCPFWIKNIFQIIESYAVSLHAKLAHYCFYLIIQNSRNISADLSRHISTNYIEKSIILLTSSTELLSKNALLCLNELMNVYRAGCSQYKQKIEAYVFNKLENDLTEVVHNASICYAKLPYLYKNSATNNVDMWYVYFKSMLKNANIILNELFEEFQPVTHVDQNESAEMMIENNQEEKKLDSSTTATPSTSTSNRFDHKLFAKIQKNPENLEFYYKKSLKRFQACCLCLANLLEPLGEHVIIKVRPLEIIYFIKRVFLFDFKKLVISARINTESKYLCSIIEQLFNSVLKFSEKFISVLKTNLLPQSQTINNFLIQLGSTIFDNNLSDSIGAYFSCLNEWISSTGTNSAFHKYSTSTVEKLLEIIKPKQKGILTIETGKVDATLKNNKLKLAATNRHHNESMNDMQSNATNQIQKEKIKDQIMAALNFLKSYIKYFNEKPTQSELNKKIQQTVVEILFVVQFNSNIRKPYDEDDVRLCLYETLLAMCHTRNVKMPPPISIAVNLFKNALSDPSKEIKSFSQNSLHILKAYTYPARAVYTHEYAIPSDNNNSQQFLQFPTNDMTNKQAEQQHPQKSQINLEQLSKNLKLTNLNLPSQYTLASLTSVTETMVSNVLNLKPVTQKNPTNNEQPEQQTFTFQHQNATTVETSNKMNEFKLPISTSANEAPKESIESMKNSLSLGMNPNNLKRKLTYEEEEPGLNSKKYQVDGDARQTSNRNKKLNKNENSNGQDDEEDDLDEEEDEDDDEDEEDLEEDEDDMEEEVIDLDEEDDEDNELDEEEEDEDDEDEDEEDELEEEDTEESDRIQIKVDHHEVQMDDAISYPGQLSSVPAPEDCKINANENKLEISQIQDSESAQCNNEVERINSKLESQNSEPIAVVVATTVDVSSNEKSNIDASTTKIKSLLNETGDYDDEDDDEVNENDDDDNVADDIDDDDEIQEVELDEDNTKTNITQEAEDNEQKSLVSTAAVDNTMAFASLNEEANQVLPSQQQDESAAENKSSDKNVSVDQRDQNSTSQENLPFSVTSDNIDGENVNDKTANDDNDEDGEEMVLKMENTIRDEANIRENGELNPPENDNDNYIEVNKARQEANFDESKFKEMCSTLVSTSEAVGAAVEDDNLRKNNSQTVSNAD